MSVTSAVTVTVLNPPVTSMASGGIGGSSSSSAPDVATLETNAKLDRIFQMVTTSQQATQQSIEVLRAEFRKEQEETAERAAKKARLSAEVSFKRKGNERQYHFNESLQEQLHTANTRLQEVSASSLTVSSALQQAQLAIEEGTRMLKLRQKAIRLADRSEFGWSFVAEYDADELADDSDDERKIEKAEKAAERKAAMAKKKGGRSVQQSASYGREAPSNRFLQGRRVPDVVPAQQSPAVFPGRQMRPVTGAGACFFCGEFGHFRRNCPKGGAAAVAKQYPFECDIYNDCDLYDLLPVGHHVIEGQDPDAGLSTPVWELDFEDLNSIKVQGGLRQHLSYWIEVLNAPDWVVDAIQYGYVLPLFSSPTPYFGCNHGSAVANHDFVSLAIQELLVTNCIAKVESQPFICSPLSVVDGPSKKRLVINLRHLNQFLWKQSFKYEDLRIALMLF